MLVFCCHHFLQSGQRPFIEPCQKGQGLFPVDHVDDAKWFNAEMTLNEFQHHDWRGLNNDGFDLVAETPLHHGMNENRPGRSQTSTHAAKTGFYRQPGPFEDPRARRGSAIAELGVNIRQQVGTCRREEALIADQAALVVKQHMNRPVIVELVSLAAVGLSKGFPSGLLDEGSVTKSEGLVKFMPICVSIGGFDGEDHACCPGSPRAIVASFNAI